MITSFDIFGGSNLPWIEIYGTQGSLSLGDPNYFNGEVKLRSTARGMESLDPHLNAGRTSGAWYQRYDPIDS